MRLSFFLLALIYLFLSPAMVSAECRFRVTHKGGEFAPRVAIELSSYGNKTLPLVKGVLTESVSSNGEVLLVFDTNYGQATIVVKPLQEVENEYRNNWNLYLPSRVIQKAIDTDEHKTAKGAVVGAAVGYVLFGGWVRRALSAAAGGVVGSSRDTIKYLSVQMYWEYSPQMIAIGVPLANRACALVPSKAVAKKVKTKTKK